MSMMNRHDKPFSWIIGPGGRKPATTTNQQLSLPNLCQPLINKPKRLFIWGRYRFSSQVLLFGGITTINQPGFINQGLTLLT